MKKNNLNNILLFVYVLILFAFSTFGTVSSAADFSVKINNMRLTSNLDIIPVYGSIGNIDTNQKIGFNFIITGASNSVDICSALAGDSCAISEKKPELTTKYHTTQKELLVNVSSNFVKSNYNGKLFDLEINFLPLLDFYYNSTYLEITPSFVTIGNDTIILPEEKSKITIKPIEANQNYHESISLPIPNPFSYELDTYFSIEQETILNIIIYNSDGQVIQKIPGKEDFFKYWIQNASREFVELKENSKIPRGLYKLNLKPYELVISTGIYRLLFETEKKSYLINISYIK